MHRAALITVALLLLAGCTSVTETFPGHDSDQVWTALVAVAESPEYDDPDPSHRWWVKENRVRTIPEEGRIEIYRELDRILRKPGYKPQREQRTWKLQVLLEAGDVPRAKMISRAYAIPVHAQQEADRYFADVRELLGGLPMSTPDASADDANAGAATQPAREDEPAPFIDVDALEPNGG